MTVYSVPVVQYIAKGTSTGTGADQTLASGLSAAPDIVSVVPFSSDASVHVWAHDDTGSFNVHAQMSDGKGFNWTVIIF